MHNKSMYFSYAENCAKIKILSPEELGEAIDEF